jgi:hypothetical protein
MEPSKYRELAGTLSLDTATGEIDIPVSFTVADVSSDSFSQGADPSPDFVAPCAPIPNEFINVNFVNDPSKPTNLVTIKWAINSYRMLSYKIIGFVD